MSEGFAIEDFRSGRTYIRPGVPARPVQPTPQPRPQPVAQPQPVHHTQPAQHVEKPQPVKAKKKFGVGKILKKWWWLAALVLALTGLLVYFAYNYFDTRNQLLNQSASGKGTVEDQKIVEEISRYMQLPNETPTVATVSDVSKLQGQEFFTNAQNGDKVLVFSQSSRALLYRPSSHKVIEYAKVDLNNTPQP